MLSHKLSNSMGLVTVISAEYKFVFTILLQFNGGVKGTVDLNNYQDGVIFEPLRILKILRNSCWIPGLLY